MFYYLSLAVQNETTSLDELRTVITCTLQTKYKIHVQYIIFKLLNLYETNYEKNEYLIKVKKKYWFKRIREIRCST